MFQVFPDKEGNECSMIRWAIFDTLGFQINIFIIFILLINYRYKQFNCLNN